MSVAVALVTCPADAADAQDYQTTFAAERGSVAAPTAGLHFDQEIFHRLDEAAVQYARGCQYEPARKDGVKVRMWYDLKVSFTLGG